MGITLRMAAKAPAGSNKLIYKRLNSKELIFFLVSRIRADFDNHFAEVFTLKKTDECFGGIFDSVDNGFFPFDLALSNPFSHIGVKLLHFVKVVSDNKTLHGQLFSYDIGQIGRPRNRFGDIVHGDHTAQNDTSMGVHMLKGRFQMHPTHIFEINVDAFGAVFADFGDNITYRL
jgi:hypothetical protein